MNMRPEFAAAKNTPKSFPNPPEAYRAWCRWAAVLDGGVYQVKHAKHYMHDLPPERVTQMLCEVYARAVFETAFGWHFDQLDSRADQHVQRDICELFDAETFDVVKANVAQGGVLIQR